MLNWIIEVKFVSFWIGKKQFQDKIYAYHLLFKQHCNNEKKNVFNHIGEKKNL
jgi:hypothetical protein